jgi:hypothetical protein
LVGSIYGKFSLKMLILSRSINKHGRHRKKNVSDWLISKGDNGKSYLSFNSLKARVISLLTVYYNGEVF